MLAGARGGHRAESERRESSSQPISTILPATDPPVPGLGRLFSTAQAKANCAVDSLKTQLDSDVRTRTPRRRWTCGRELSVTD